MVQKMKQHMIIPKMIKHSYADTTRGVLEDDMKKTKERWLQKNIQLRSMMKMYDVVPKNPMIYRVSPVSCTVVIVAVSTTVEFLPS